jgi:ribosomal protein L21E
MNNKIIIGISIILIGASFYGGMTYGKKSVANQAQTRRFQGQAGNFIGANGQMGRNGAGGNAVGEVISKSDKSFVIKLRDGGSKIVIFTSSTQIRKSTEANLNEVAVGTTVVVNGQANADGSLTAQLVQLRDASSTPFGPGPGADGQRQIPPKQ